MGIILLVVLLYVVPTEYTDYTEAYRLKLFESTEWPTLRDARIHRNECLLVCVLWELQAKEIQVQEPCATIGSEPCLTSASLHKQPILCFLSYDAQRLYALEFRNINPVGFCVVCAFCGNFSPHYSKAKNAMRTSLRLLRKGLTK